MPTEKWNIERVMQSTGNSNRRNLILVGQYVKDAAKLLCPVDTGNLRDNMDSRMINDDTVRVFNPTSYAIYPEFGTRFQSAQPYLRPALFNSKEAIKSLLRL